MESTNKSTKSEMLKKNITLGELLVAGLAVIGSVLAFWINVNVRLAILEKDIVTSRESYERIEKKLDNIERGQTDILLQLKDKENRK